MEVRTYPPRLYDPVECSSCGYEVERLYLSSHDCQGLAGYETKECYSPSTYSDHLSPDSTFEKTLFSQPYQPTLPSITPSPTVHNFPISDILTPPRSATGPAPYLSTPTSSFASPLRSPYGESPRISNRPPSPKLSNLDCAFPPFPTTSKKRYNSKSSVHSRTRTGTSSTYSSSKGSKSNISVSTGSANSSMRRPARSTTTDSRSRPSTAASSRQSSFGSGSGIRKESLPANTLPSQYGDGADHSYGSNVGNPLPYTPIQATHIRGPSMGDESYARNPDTSSAVRDLTAVQRDVDPSKPSTLAFRNMSQSGQIDVDATPTQTKESHYKTRKPPPIMTNALPPMTDHLHSAKANGGHSATPSTSGKIGMTFARLFGRQTSHSKNRDVVRQALSDSPEEYSTAYVPNVSAISPDSEIDGPRSASIDPSRSLSLASQPHLPSGPMYTMPPFGGRSSSEPEEMDQDLSTSSYRRPNPVLERSQTCDNLDHGSSGAPLSPIYEIKHAKSTPELRRASIDSASSYGSIGFTEHTRSSRSSDPPVEELTRKMSNATYLELLESRSKEDNTQLKGLGILSEPPGPQSKALKPPQCVLPSKEWHGSTEPKLDHPRKAVNKGLCRGCSEVILAGQKSVKSADGRLTGRYHRSCFVCHACQEPFPTAEFYVHDDLPYCAQHYHELENSLCSSCGYGIEGEYVETANSAGAGVEKHHPGCLRCTTCQAQLNQDYFEMNGKCYCERDAFRIAGLAKIHENLPSRSSPLAQEYLGSSDQSFPRTTAYPERRTTRLITTLEANKLRL